MEYSIFILIFDIKKTIFLLKKYILDNTIIKINFPNIHNKTAGPIIFIFFQDIYILRRIEFIRLFFLE